MTTFTTQDRLAATAKPKEGSRWSGGDKHFRVLHVIDQDGHTWVHYRDEPKQNLLEPIKEYSCYLESFLSRFNQVPE